MFLSHNTNDGTVEMFSLFAAAYIKWTNVFEENQMIDVNGFHVMYEEKRNRPKCTKTELSTSESLKRKKQLVLSRTGFW